MSERLDANRRRYDAVSRVYARLLRFGSAGRISQLYEAVAEALDVPPGALVVELGCGPATLTPYLLERVGAAGRVVGVDFSPAMIERARQSCQRAGWPRVRFECGDACEYDPPELADAVVFCLSLTTMPDCLGCLEHALRMLKPGGQLLILDSIPEPSRPISNLVIRLKAPLVGAKPTRLPLDFTAARLQEFRARPLFGGVYSLLSGGKRAAEVDERATE